jgi:hypothetical protein
MSCLRDQTAGKPFCLTATFSRKLKIAMSLHSPLLIADRLSMTNQQQLERIHWHCT